MSLVVRDTGDGSKPSPVQLKGESSSPVYSVRFNNDGQFVAAGGKDRSLTLWNLELDGEKQRLPGEHEQEYLFEPALHKSAITSVRWSSVNESQVITSSADGTAALFDLNESKKIKTFRHASSGCVNQVDNSKRDMLVTCCDDGSVKVWDVRSKEPVSTIETPYPVLTCCVDYDEHGVFFSGIDPQVHCYDPRNTSKPLWEETAQANNVTSLSLCNEYLLSKSTDGTIKYFNSSFTTTASATRRRAKPYVLDGPKASNSDWLIRSKLVSEGKSKFTAFSGSSDGYVYQWDLASRRLVSRLAGHSGPVYDVDYNGKKLVSASADGTLILREV